MKTKLPNKTLVDWDELFDQSTHHRDVTCEFAEKIRNGNEWLSDLYDAEAYKAAKRMIRCFGVQGVRARAVRWMNRNFA